MSTASSSEKRFRHLRGIDYGGEGEAVGINSVKTRSLDACIDACAARSNCRGDRMRRDRERQRTGAFMLDEDEPDQVPRVRQDWGFAVLVPAERWP